MSTIGTARLDNLVRDVRYACRSLLRAPLVALTIVTTVGLGLGLVAVVFTSLSAFVFRADEVRKPDELFAVQRQRSADTEPERFTRAEYDALLRETDVFAGAFASTPDVHAWFEGTRREGRLVTGNFFQVLGVGAARGRTFTPSDNQPGGPRVLVLSHRAWIQHFSSDPGVIGRTIRVNAASFTIVGVTPAGFRGLDIVAAPDFWAPLSLLGQFRPDGDGPEQSADLEIVGRLEPGLSRGQALAQLRAWDSRHAAEHAGERPAASLLLEPKQGTVPLSADVLLLFMPLFFAFGLILMIGCANVANLLLARGLVRQREIGIRLSIGASRRRVVFQLLTESLLLALVAAALAFGVSRLVLEGVVRAVTSTFPPNIGNLRIAVPAADWRLALFFVAGALVSTLFFALAPALRATRLDLVRAMHGEVGRDTRPGRARNVLVALQVAGSALLLIWAAVFLRSTWTAATTDPGIRTDDIVTVNVLNEAKRGAILDVVQSEPLAASAAASLPPVLGGIPAFAGAESGRSPVTYQFVSPEYFGVFGIDLVRGRGFAQTERSASAAVAVVSESVARRLWPGADAVGRVLRLESDAENASRPPNAPPPVPSQSFVVVGVARDVPGFQLGNFRLAGAGIYVPISPQAAATSLMMRAHGDAQRARHDLVDRLAAIDPNMAEVSTLQTYVSEVAYLLSIPFWLTLGLGALALFLTLSGLFSVLSYVVEQRTQEIGVRTALGATRARIGALVLSQTARPVGIGLLLGSGLAAALGAALLATPAVGLIASTVRLFDPLAYAASLLLIVAACVCAGLIPALRAARVDPVGALRQD
jgi:predicted permease